MNKKVINVENLTHIYKVPDKEFMEKASAIKKIFYRKYVDFYALKNISFSINEGEIVGYIGRNGAGKTTTIKILAGILEPSKGKVEVMGKDPYKYRKEIAKDIALVFGNRENVFFDIPLIESIKFFSRIYEVEEWQERARYLGKLLNIEELFDMPVRKMSFGQRKKANILVAFLHHPKIAFLDEPTIGLDIFAKDEMRKFLKRINRDENTTIMLTSHYMEDIEELADRVIWLEEGEIKADKTYEELIDSVDYKILRVEVLKGKSEWMKKLTHERHKGNFYEYLIRKKELKKYIRIISQDENIKDISILSPSLEDIIKAGLL